MSPGGPGAGATGGLRAGLCSIAFRHLPATQVADLAARCGLEGVEWGGDVHVPPGDVVAARRVADHCRGLGLACPSYGSYLAAGSPERGGPDAIDAALDVTQTLGARNIRVWAGATASADCDPAERARVTEDLSSWVERAAHHQVTVSVELHSGTLTDCLESARELLDAVPGLWTYWQPRDGDAGDADLAELSTLVPRLSHVHVFWWRNWLERFSLADGEDFWRRALALASPVGASQGWPGDHWSFIEFVAGDDPDQLAADADALQRWTPVDR